MSNAEETKDKAIKLIDELHSKAYVDDCLIDEIGLEEVQKMFLDGCIGYDRKDIAEALRLLLVKMHKDLVNQPSNKHVANDYE